MILLAILAAALAAAAMWFLVRPLVRGTSASSHEQYYQLASARDRLLAQLNELDLHERDRSMDAGIAAEERARLESELAETLKRIEALQPESAKSAVPPSRAILAVVAVAVPLVAIAVYLINVSVVPTRLEQIAAAQPAAVSPPNPMQMVARLEKRLQENPNDLRGWLTLGRSYVVLGQAERAMAAYDHAYPLLPADFKADSADALWFLGWAAHNHGEIKRAVGFWKELLASLPPDSEPARQLKAIIDKTGRAKAPAPSAAAR